MGTFQDAFRDVRVSSSVKLFYSAIPVDISCSFYIYSHSKPGLHCPVSQVNPLILEGGGGCHRWAGGEIVGGVFTAVVGDGLEFNIIKTHPLINIICEGDTAHQNKE